MFCPCLQKKSMPEDFEEKDRKSRRNIEFASQDSSFKDASAMGQTLVHLEPLSGSFGKRLVPKQPCGLTF